MKLFRMPPIGGWRELAHEAVWRATARPVPSPPPTWPLSTADLARVEVRWPTTYEYRYAAEWVATLRSALERKVRVTPAEVPQPYTGTVVLRFVVDGRALDVPIDIADKAEINLHVVERHPLCFKMQFRRGGYGIDHVVPGGYVPGQALLYTFLAAVRRTRDAGVFDDDVYGRYGLEFAEGIRRRAVELLREQRSFQYQGGLGKVRYGRYLAETARAKVCIDLPGNGDFCFRLVDYLAVGACVIGPRPGNELHVPLVDREHIVFIKDDLSDLVELCEYYVANDAERERIARNARAYFDAYLHKDQLAGYYLTTVLRRLS